MSDSHITSNSSNDDKRIDEIIGGLLRTGVILAATVVFIGALLFLARYGSSPEHYRVFQGEPSNLRHVASIFHDAVAGDVRGIIQLGLLLLIATPVARVVFTVFAFIYERDWTYVVITLIVLTLLLYSLGAFHF
ncbi:MAG TPA: DUF1634 domain-containing protein [Candidatus Acidoferrales bacterium]|nr:DUF1634 domain-containing protein [Candidatus Acidoferrales bacterium]